MLNENYLYVIAVPTRLKTVDVVTASAMAIVDSIIVQRNMETLFRLGDKLFVGTTTGMLILRHNESQNTGPDIGIQPYNRLRPRGG